MVVCDQIDFRTDRTIDLDSARVTDGLASYCTNAGEVIEDQAMIPADSTAMKLHQQCNALISLYNHKDQITITHTAIQPLCAAYVPFSTA